MRELYVKICGLSNRQSVDAAILGGASHIGFIFFEKSPRHVSPELAGELVRTVGSKARSVAVTVDTDDTTLDHIVSSMSPAMLQLHGNEAPERVSALRSRYGLPVIKAVSVRDSHDLDAARNYAAVADVMLLDAKPPAGAELPGGNGISFDWSLLDGLDRDMNYILSGGLNLNNIDEALSVAKPAGIDISSGVERAPGVKDVGKIAAFLRHVSEIRQSTPA